MTLQPLAFLRQRDTDHGWRESPGFAHASMTTASAAGTLWTLWLTSTTPLAPMPTAPGSR